LAPLVTEVEAAKVKVSLKLSVGVEGAAWFTHPSAKTRMSP
jgi:hypothetical protein